jgi:hypothetical protein
VSEKRKIIKTAFVRKKQDKRKRLLENMGVCIEAQKILGDRIKKLIAILTVN